MSSADEDAGRGRTGTAQSLSGQRQCEDCARGTFSDTDRAEECEPCGPGQTSDADSRATGCIPCAAGTALDAQTARCVECPAGTFARAEAAACEPCAVGSYGAGSGASSCVACVFGTTERVGRTSAADCRGFTQTRLQVTSLSGVPTAGGAVGLRVAFRPLMNVRPGERLVLGLPAFSNPAGITELELQGDLAQRVVG